jgi:hypothetical protein
MGLATRAWTAGTELAKRREGYPFYFSRGWLTILVALLNQESLPWDASARTMAFTA